MEAKTQIEIVREKCEEKGLNIYDVLREAKVPQTTVQNWKTDPKAFQTLAKIENAIEVCAEAKRLEEERIKEVFRKNRRTQV